MIDGVVAMGPEIWNRPWAPFPSGSMHDRVGSMRYAACLLILCCASAEAAPTEPGPTVDIKAARMELSQKTGVVHFEGQVVVKQNNMELQCERLEARYGKKGILLELKAWGQIQVISPQWTAQADTATYEREGDVLKLRGKPRVHRGEDWLEGTMITVHLEEQRLVVERARGQFKAPTLNKKNRP